MYLYIYIHTKVCISLSIHVKKVKNHAPFQPNWVDKSFKCKPGIKNPTPNFRSWLWQRYGNLQQVNIWFLLHELLTCQLGLPFLYRYLPIFVRHRVLQFIFPLITFAVNCCVKPMVKKRMVLFFNTVGPWWVSTQHLQLDKSLHAKGLGSQVWS